jgi:Zn-dependent peptidase ImmA (M78 family)
MGYTIRSKIESRALALRIGRMAERWCRSNMGINKRKKYDPTIAYYKSYEGDLDMGEYRYWDNEIIIYYNNCGNIKNLIRTVIHEWQHQLQPMTKYEALDTKYGYRKNPLEIEAEAAEEKHYKQLWIEIKPKLNKI